MNEYISRNELIIDFGFSYDDIMPTRNELISLIKRQPAVDVVPAKHGRCFLCVGKKPLLQDADNGYSLEVDGEQQEISVWRGDECVAVFQIDYCPICGCKIGME